MELTPWMFIVACPLCFLAGLVDAMAGGGGLISVPAYLLAGLPPHLASGTNKLSASIGTCLASWRYARTGNIMLAPAITAVAGALPGAVIGAKLLLFIPEDTVRVLLIVIIPCVAVFIVLKRNIPAAEKPMTRKRFIACFFIGLFVGVYDGFIGPGTGTFLIILFTYVVGMDIVRASGTSKLVNLASNIGALATLIMEGKVLYLLGIPVALCTLAGSYIGSGLAIRGGAKSIRFVMLIVLALLIIRLAADLLTA